MNRIPLACVGIGLFFLSGCGKDDSAGRPSPGDKPRDEARDAGLPGGNPGKPGGPAEPASDPQWREAAAKAIEKGAAYLRAEAREGKWGFKPGEPDLGISALAARALLRSPERKVEDVRAALDWLAANQKPDGGIYDKAVAVYVTATSILALEASGDAKYRPVIRKAAEYLRVAQTDEAEGRTPSSEDYGGIGYGGKGDVNLSTTHFALEAASEAGLAKDDDFYKKALVFLQRCQNRSESNTSVHVLADGSRVEPGNDGGAIYRPAESKAGIETLPDGRKIFRSYGSMTYALLKSYLLCDLDAKDARVKAALDWIGRHWELDFNPGMEAGEQPEAKYQGLYYYYLTLARTLGAAERQGVDLTLAGIGRWREDLARKLVARQAADGSWTNPVDRWMEGSPVLVTAYALLAIQDCVASGR